MEKVCHQLLGPSGSPPIGALGTRIPCSVEELKHVFRLEVACFWPSFCSPCPTAPRLYVLLERVENACACFEDEGSAFLRCRCQTSVLGGFADGGSGM